ncbi:Phage integrase family protein [Nitrosovibrio tenuis]|uniref:Phage integrase family protein n=2 Tax=Nitrosovibrio tenuis TaxID=1233 RepID=A0A1H7RXW4_9PROT|nr:Phage integrase family protein [Nitrosovibrio tenuis]
MVLLWYHLMKLLLGRIFSLDIRYVYLRGKTHYYQRKIPTDLLSRYPGSTHIKVNLKTSDPASVAKKVRELNRHYESTWAAMRGNPDLQPLSVRESAIKLLARYGLQPKPFDNDEHLLDNFIEVLRRKEESHAESDSEIYHSAEPEDYLESTEIEALRLLNEEPKFRLSNALQVYLDGHKNKNKKKFRTDTQRAWGRLIEIIGDKEIEQVSRADANEFVSRGLAEGVRTTTIGRHVSILRAVFNVAIVEREIAKQNPFLRLRIPGLGEDAKVRESYDNDQLTTLIQECRKSDDDVRWLLALQIDLGCRIAEAAGLLLEDLHLETPIPYVSIRPHPWRTLKTKSSKRNVPLVGVSLWAAQRIIQSAQPGQTFAFSRYTDKEQCKATHASNTINQWIESRLGVGKTTHEFRHTIRDRLRNVGAPKDIQDAVGGWGKEDIGDKYGLGYGLGQLKGWLDKIVI